MMSTKNTSAGKAKSWMTQAARMQLKLTAPRAWLLPLLQVRISQTQFNNTRTKYPICEATSRNSKVKKMVILTNIRSESRSARFSSKWFTIPGNKMRVILWKTRTRLASTASLSLTWVGYSRDNKQISHVPPIKCFLQSSLKWMEIQLLGKTRVSKQLIRTNIKTWDKELQTAQPSSNREKCKGRALSISSTQVRMAASL